MTTVLLTNAIGPYDLGWGEDMTDLFGARLTRGQGPFSLRGFFSTFAFYLIAENIKVPAVILEHPDEAVFRKELQKGYDYIGLQVVTVHIPRIAKMVRIIKEISPKSKIVLGGYGVSTLYHPPPHDPDNDAQFILDNADYVCREEGVGFFRNILGQDPGEPITQLHMPPALSTVRGMENIAAMPTTSTLVALGCPNACEFCNTSAFFRFKKIFVSTPEQTVETLKTVMKKYTRDRFVYNMLWNEDFLLDRPYVMRFARLLQEAGLIGKVNISSFASIRSVSQYTTEELIMAGIGALWIGVESKFDDVVTSVHQFQKRAGKDIREVFEDLHRYGIKIIASSILGLDFHTPENIEEDIDYFVSLKPDFYQVAPLTPCPGTMLYDRMMEENRLYDNFSFEHVQIWSDRIFKHANFDDGRIRHYFDLCHKKLYETNGPSLLNISDVLMQGYKTMVHSTNPFLQAAADRCYFESKYMQGDLYYSLKELAPNETVRKRAEAVEKEFLKYCGDYRPVNRLIQKFIYRRLLRESTNTARESDPPWEIIRFAGDKSAPKVVARRDPVKSFLRQSAHGLIRRSLRIGVEPDRAIRLADIDDFPVTFHYIDIEGDRINYVDEGAGETILMIHGNATWSYLYRHLIRDLKKNFRCVAIDLLGYGLSDKPPRADYSMEAHIRRLEIFVDRLGLKDITLVCQDWGGIIGLSYAAANKERFKRLIPMNTTGFLPETPAEVMQCLGAHAFPYLWSYKIPVLGKRMAMDWNLFLRSSMRLGIHNKNRLNEKAMAGYLYPFQRPHERTAIMKSVRQIPVGPFGPIARLLKQTRRNLDGWDVRTRVIWGMKDPVFVPWFIKKFEELLPNHAPSVKIATASHYLQDDEPDRIIAGIREFMTEDAMPNAIPTAAAG
ncbi:MAG: alpha/beta fold hydrolase [Thermodesulfobacteriota bacterium]